MRRLLNTLFITTQGAYLSKSNANISTGGIFYKHKKPFLRGSIIDLNFMLPGESKIIQAKVEIMHVCKEASLFGLGTKFIDLTTKDLERIENFIKC